MKSLESNHTTEHLLSLYKEVRDLHARVLVEFKNLTDDCGGLQSLEGVADSTILLRETSELFDDLRKATDRMNKAIANSTALTAVAEGTPEVPKGRFARATIKSVFAVRVPSHSKDPIAYQELCDALGVPYHEMTRLHFPTIRDIISKKVSQGENIGPVLQKYQQYSETTVMATSLPGKPLNDV